MSSSLQTQGAVQAPLYVQLVIIFRWSRQRAKELFLPSLQKMTKMTLRSFRLEGNIEYLCYSVSSFYIFNPINRLNFLTVFDSLNL